MSQISTIFKRALLHFSLPSFTSFNKHSQELVLLSARQVSETLDIHVSSPDVENYKNVPLTAWTQVHNLLSSIYVATAKVAYEKGQPLLEFNVLFEEWCGYSVELCDIDNQDQYEVIFGDEKDQTRLQKFNEVRKKSNLPEIPIRLLSTSTTHVYESNTNIYPNRNISFSTDRKRYEHVAVGGTFDHLHAGHKILLTMSAWITGKRLVCGVTGNNMLKTKELKELLESLDTRVSNVARFLNRIRRGIKYEVVPIYDIYGPTVTDPDIEALVVSRETISNAHSINEERRKHSFKPLEMAIIEVISSDNSSLDEAQLKNLKISSTFIRKYLSGQIIDRSDKRT